MLHDGWTRSVGSAVSCNKFRTIFTLCVESSSYPAFEQLLFSTELCERLSEQIPRMGSNSLSLISCGRLHEPISSQLLLLFFYCIVAFFQMLNNRWECILNRVSDSVGFSSRLFFFIILCWRIGSQWLSCRFVCEDSCTFRCFEPFGYVS